MAADILSRFLKLYHSLEYLIYRVYLVELANKVGTSKIFVREFINASESMKKGEKESFCKNFIKIFDSDKAKIRAELLPEATANVISFLATQKIVKAFNLALLIKWLN